MKEHCIYYSNLVQKMRDHKKSTSKRKFTYRDDLKIQLEAEAMTMMKYTDEKNIRNNCKI